MRPFYAFPFLLACLTLTAVNGLTTPAVLAQPSAAQQAASCPNPEQRIEVTVVAASTPTGLGWAFKELPGEGQIFVCDQVRQKILAVLRGTTLVSGTLTVQNGVSLEQHLMFTLDVDVQIVPPAWLGTAPQPADAGTERPAVFCVTVNDPAACAAPPAATALIEIATGNIDPAATTSAPGVHVFDANASSVPIKLFYSDEDLAAARKDSSVTDDTQAHARVREELMKVAEAVRAEAFRSGGLDAEGKPVFNGPSDPRYQQSFNNFIPAVNRLYNLNEDVFAVEWAKVTPDSQCRACGPGAAGPVVWVWSLKGLRLVEAVNIEVVEESWETKEAQGETIAAKLRKRRQAAYDKLDATVRPDFAVKPGHIASRPELGSLTQGDVVGTGDLHKVETEVEAVEKVKSGPLVTPSRPATPGAPEGRNLIYAVRRKKKPELTLAFQVSGSYSKEDGATGRVGVEEINLLRLNETIGLSAQAGGEVQRYRFSFTRPFKSSGKPGFELKDFSVDAKVFKDEDKRLGNLTTEEIEAREVGSSANLSFGYDSVGAADRANVDCLTGPDRPPRTRYGFLANVGLNYRDVNIREDDKLLAITGVGRDLLPRERTQATTASLGVQALLSHDFRRPGAAGLGLLVLRFDETAQKGFQLFGADYEYWKTQTVGSASLTFGFSSFRDMFVAYRHGHERSSEGTPLFELPLLGGPTSVRGLEEGEFIGQSVTYDQFELGVNIASVYNLLARKGRLKDTNFCPFSPDSAPAGPFDPRNLYVKGFFDHGRLSDSPVAPASGGALRRANGYGFAVELRDMMADASGRRVNLSIGYGRSPHSRLHRSGMMFTGVTFEF